MSRAGRKGPGPCPHDGHCLDLSCRRARQQAVNYERRLAREWIIKLGILAFFNGVLVGIGVERFLLGG